MKIVTILKKILTIIIAFLTGLLSFFFIKETKKKEKETDEIFSKKSADDIINEYDNSINIQSNITKEQAEFRTRVRNRLKEKL
jgi:uncharacterized membrane protein YraQ (UPF0718 family)